MKKIETERVKELVAKMQELVRENPEYMGAMPEVRAIVKFDKEDNGISTELFNEIVLDMPLTLVQKLRRYGIDLPKYNYGEKLE